MRCPSLALAAFAAFASCASTDHHEAGAPAVAALEAPAAPAQSQAPEEDASAELSGVLFPARTRPISLWLEEYRGELLVLEVLEHGSLVEAGQPLVKLDMRALQQQLEDARLSLTSMSWAHDALKGRNEIAAQAAEQRLARTQAAYQRAKRSLEGYENQEAEFRKRSDQLAQARESAWLDDQKDELEQLEAMYSADELVDATEEIVLKRSRRDLANTEKQNSLSADQRGYRTKLTEKLSAEARREDVERQEQELAHLRRTQAIEAASRADAERRSAAELAKAKKRLQRLEGDATMRALKVHAGGMLLHGDLDAARAGASSSRIERGGQLAQRRDLFLLAEPGPLNVALTIPESERSTWRDGAAVRVAPTGSDQALTGRLSVAAMPNGTQGSEATFEATVLVDGQWEGLVPGMHATVSLVEQP